MDIAGISGLVSGTDDAADMPEVAAKAPKAGGRIAGGTFAKMWDASHSYVLVAAGKCGIARGVSLEHVTNSEGHKLNEWYLAACAGNGSHQAHLLTFGGIGEYSQHGRGQHGKTHEILSLTGETLAYVRNNRVKPSEPAIGHAAAVAKWTARLGKLGVKAQASK